MYKLFVTAGLIALNAPLILILPSRAQEVSKNSDCTATVASVQKYITNGRDVEVTLDISDISSEYSDYPDNRPYKYLFILQGKASDSILNSPKFMGIISKKIINNCESVSLVQFIEYKTDFFISIGLMPGGSIGKFECLEAGKDVAQSWGQEFCH
jgi:hypothetical protein